MENDSDSGSGRPVNLYFIIGSNVFAGNDAHEISGAPSPSSNLESEVMRIIKELRLLSHDI